MSSVPAAIATHSPPALPLPIRLSQGLLSLLATCPRKFQHLYIEQLSPYTLPDVQMRMTAGSQFHALLQQWQMGLPVEPLAASDRQLAQWFTTFIAAVPEILGPDVDTLRSSEQPRTLEFEGYLLTVVYDLLVLGAAQAQILDWKTYARPENPQYLRLHWQTRLYLFVLVETSPYPPEQVAMVYWFFQASQPQVSQPQASQSTDPGQSQRFSIAYDRRQHEQTRADLSRLLAQLNQMVARYQQGEAFPQVPVDSPECGRCSFAWRCDRASSDRAPGQDQSPPAPFNPPLDPALNTLAELEMIQEIPL
jgi:PD-(D/E)XK nuclease superfamily